MIDYDIYTLRAQKTQENTLAIIVTELKQLILSIQLANIIFKKLN